MVVSIQEITPTPTQNTNNNLNLLQSRYFTVKIDNRDDFAFTVNMTSNAEQVRNWITDTTKTIFATSYDAHCLVIGLGIEWTPRTNTAATIQLCARERVLIYRLRLSHASTTCPPELQAFLCDPRITFVGLWDNHNAIFATNKLRKTNPNLSFLGPEMPIPLRNHLFHPLNGRSLRRDSTRAIVNIILRVEIDTHDYMSDDDWEGDQLSLQQVSVASVNAFVSYKLGMHIQAWCFNPSHLASQFFQPYHHHLFHHHGYDYY